ncbi:hypothetical protein A0H81_01694 [Grifola frondosa]|uniref:Uncharacterized protein n=1 Tax=Grifola frondosa TaxID=5627 RepID=A0A1C7MLF5_GRIFR|nr:hypothetical protein A0H81_01694 [Grifola frondosa]
MPEEYFQGESVASNLLSRILFYHSLARSLERGSASLSNSRPPLPRELILSIFRLAELVIPSSSVSCSEQSDVRSNGNLAEKIWFATPPLRCVDLTKLAFVKLETVSRHQGWVSDPACGCWSWFELGILRGRASADADRTLFSRLKTREDGSRLSWKSHCNNLHGRGSYDLVEGQTFGTTHELWDCMQEGDAIVVIGAAQYPGWACYGKEAVLRFGKYFEPTLY